MKVKEEKRAMRLRSAVAGFEDGGGDRESRTVSGPQKGERRGIRDPLEPLERNGALPTPCESLLDPPPPGLADSRPVGFGGAELVVFRFCCPGDAVG